MPDKSTGDKHKKSTKGSAGTYGFAPLGYVELAGTREALQKAAEEIIRLKKEVRQLKKKVATLKRGPRSKSKKKT
ncbi:MAG: hypothetical protein ACE5GH_06280 [Fidelibacterota bacterium]